MESASILQPKAKPMPCQHPFDAPRPAKMPPAPMDPRERLARFGRILPMEEDRGLLQRLRILFNHA